MCSLPYQLQHHKQEYYKVREIGSAHNTRADTLLAEIIGRHCRSTFLMANIDDWQCWPVCHGTQPTLSAIKNDNCQKWQSIRPKSVGRQCWPVYWGLSATVPQHQNNYSLYYELEVTHFRQYNNVLITLFPIIHNKHTTDINIRSTVHRTGDVTNIISV